MIQRTGMPCVVMFIDVCGAAELFEALGNARAQLAIASLLQTLTDTVDRHAGRTIKTIGPQIMCVFPAVRQAAAMAADAQHAARAAIQALATGALAVRVGFQYGPVINQDADVFGDAVNVAARILSHAKPGQILLSARPPASCSMPASTCAWWAIPMSRARLSRSTSWNSSGSART